MGASTLPAVPQPGLCPLSRGGGLGTRASPVKAKLILEMWGGAKSGLVGPWMQGILGPHLGPNSGRRLGWGLVCGLG